MIGRFSFFLASLQFTLSQFFPQRRQQLLEFLEEASENLPAYPCCEDVLEIWLEQFGIGGVILGNIALFGIGLLLMLAVDLASAGGNGFTSLLLRCAGALYCTLKFKCTNPAVLLLILLFVLLWLVCDFFWCIAFLFLVTFTNCGIFHSKGGSLC